MCRLFNKTLLFSSDVCENASSCTHMFKLASLVANELKRQKKPHFKFIAPVYILASSQLQ